MLTVTRNTNDQAMNKTVISCLITACLISVASCDMLSTGNDDTADIRLFISVGIMDFDESDPENNIFIVTSNMSWRAESDTPGLKLEPETGKAGDTKVQVTDMPENTTATVTVTTVRNRPEDNTVSESIEISRGKAMNSDDDPVLPDNVPWPELPETIVKNPDYKYVTHWAETVNSGKRVRNYTACYDTEKHNPVWVAYPMHACYMEGGYQRTDPDPWRPDPEFMQSEQSVIYGSDWEDWPWDGNGKATDLYQYWSPLDSGPYFVRGHLLRSGDRGGHNTLLNIQTFYPTNIAPERFLYPDVHQELEYKLPDDWTCRDTTYVVAGCHYQDDNYYVYDACSYDEQSRISKKCDLPAAQFKIYLRTKKGNTGKRICECTADELQAIGFWLPQDLKNEGEISGGDLKDFAYSVSDIEEMLGGIFSFFPEIPETVKDSYDLSDWGIR